MAEQLQTVEDHVSQRIVEAVARREEIHPVDLDPPLYEVVDPDALNQLFEASTPAGRVDGRVVFDYNEYEISVHRDGDVSVATRGVEDEERNLS